jgi:hypothetical protein
VAFLPPLPGFIPVSNSLNYGLRRGLDSSAASRLQVCAGSCLACDQVSVHEPTSETESTFGREREHSQRLTDDARIAPEATACGDSWRLLWK